jgi:hypothetical protein
MKNLVKLSLLAIVISLGTGEAFGQFPWLKDARNPILSGGAVGTWNHEVICPYVLFNNDSSRYEMWFSASSGTTPDWRPHFIGFATSHDGINWNMYSSAVLSPTPGTWDAYTVENATVIRESGQYKMWYSSYLNVAPTYPGYLGYATSPDGIHWTKYSGNPVMGPGTSAWEVGGPYTCAVMSSQGGYKMWYGGWDLFSTFVCIGYATSSDGISWQRDTVHNPVVRNGALTEWDHVRVFNPHVIQLGNMYHMWYEGSSGTGGSIGYATSADSGITWTKYALNPVLSYSPGTWEASLVEPGSVLLRSNLDSLDMWYSGGDHNSIIRVGHATRRIIDPVRELNGGVPKVFALHQNYPNPFNPTTGIRFQVSVVSDVRLVVYDILGREVAVLVHEQKMPGMYEVEFAASGLASGVYMYRLATGQYVECRKMVLMK